MRNGLRSVPSAAFLATALLLVSGCGASGGSEDAGGTTTSVAVTTTKAAATTTAVTDGTTTTTDAPTTTAESATPGSGDGVCPALKIINGYEAETRGAITRPWSELQPIFVDGTDDVINAYDDAIAAADPTLAADLTTLRDHRTHGRPCEFIGFARGVQRQAGRTAGPARGRCGRPAARRLLPIHLRVRHQRGRRRSRRLTEVSGRRSTPRSSRGWRRR